VLLNGRAEKALPACLYGMCSLEDRKVYDMVLTSAFFFVILSPLAIHAGLNLVERAALRRALARQLSGKEQDPRSAWVPETSATTAISSAAPSAR
jgi:hypothetical protein